MLPKRLAQTLLITILLTVFSAEAAEKAVNVTTLYGYPPYCFLRADIQDRHLTGEQGEPVEPGTDSTVLQGYSWEIFRESFHEMGYTIHLTVYPWARALAMTKAKKFDILFPTGKNSQREKIFHYSGEAINRVNFLVYLPADSQLPWDGLQSLAGLTIGVMRDFNYGNQWAALADVRNYEVNTILQGFRMLDRKRLDGFAGYEQIWDYALKKIGSKTQYRKLPPFEYTEEYAVGLKSTPGIEGLLRDFDSGRRRIEASGIAEKISRKWMD